MRRLWTAFTLMVLLLLVVAAFATPHVQPARPIFFIRRDVANSVTCYSSTPDFSGPFSCVYIPRDGVQVNLPKPGPSKT